MGSLRTLAGLLSLCAATGAQALPQSPSQRVQVFAICAGRLSAEVEHHRLFDGTLAETVERRRAVFVDLLEATMPDALDYGMPGAQALEWRITAKMAHATLLHRAAFERDTHMATRARSAATGFLAECDALILGD